MDNAKHIADTRPGDIVYIYDQRTHTLTPPLVVDRLTATRIIATFQHSTGGPEYTRTFVRADGREVKTPHNGYPSTWARLVPEDSPSVVGLRNRAARIEALDLLMLSIGEFTGDLRHSKGDIRHAIERVGALHSAAAATLAALEALNAPPAL